MSFAVMRAPNRCDASPAITTPAKLLYTPILLKTAGSSNSWFSFVSSKPEETKITNLINCRCPTVLMASNYFNLRSSKSNFFHVSVWISHLTKPRRHLSTRNCKLSSALPIVELSILSRPLLLTTSLTAPQASSIGFATNRHLHPILLYT